MPRQKTDIFYIYSDSQGQGPPLYISSTEFSHRHGVGLTMYPSAVLDLLYMKWDMTCGLEIVGEIHFHATTRLWIPKATSFGTSHSPKWPNTTCQHRWIIFSHIRDNQISHILVGPRVLPRF